MAGKKAKTIGSRDAEVDRRVAALTNRPTSKGVLKAKAEISSRPCTPAKDRPVTEAAKGSSSSVSHVPAQAKAQENAVELGKDTGPPAPTRAHAEWLSVVDTGEVSTTWKTSYLDSLDDGPQEIETGTRSVETRTYTAPEPGAKHEEPKEERKKAETERQTGNEDRIPARPAYPDRKKAEQAQPAVKEQTPEEYERNRAETMRNEAKAWDTMSDNHEVRTRTEQRKI